MDVTWIKRESIKRSEWFFYSFPEGRVEEPFLFPLLAYKKGNSYLLLDGHKRLNLSLEKYPLLFWDESELSPESALLLSVKANEIMRGLNSIEKGRVLAIVQKFFPESFKKFSSIIGVSERDGRALAKVDSLHEEFKLKIVKWKLPVKWVLKICEDIDGWNKVWERISDVKLSSAQMVHVIDSLWELSHREGKSVDEIISEWEKGELIDFLNDRRYPVSRKLREKISALEKKFKKSGVVPVIPWDLEGEEAKLVIRIAPDMKKEEVLENVKKILNDPLFNELLESL